MVRNAASLVLLGLVAAVLSIGEMPASAGGGAAPVREVVGGSLAPAGRFPWMVRLSMGCGGALYSHIAYPRQLVIKADVIQDAFTRLARHPLDPRIAVAASPEQGYRTRARFHIQ